MSVPYSPKHLELSGKSGQDGLFLKMFTESLISTTVNISRKFAHSWKTKATRYNRLLFQLQRLTPPTNETEFGLLRTPDAHMERGDYTKEKMQRRIAKGLPLDLNKQFAAMNYGLIPTPKSQNAAGAGIHGQGGKDLQTIIAMIPTPSARDWKGANGENHFRKGEKSHMDQLPNFIEIRSGTKTGMKL